MSHTQHETIRRRVGAWTQALIPPRLRKRLDPSRLTGLLCAVAAGAAVAGAWRVAAVGLCGAVWSIARAAFRTRGETMLAMMQITGRLSAIDAATVLYGESYAGAAPLPYTRWTLTHDALLMAVTDVRLAGCRVIVEFGAGLSTVFLARCCKAAGRGRVIAFEHNAWWASHVRALLVERDLMSWVTLIEAPLARLRLGNETYQWYARDRVEEALRGVGVDYVLVDGPPGDTGRLARYPALPIIRPYLAPGAKVMLDDGRRPDERATAARWAREYGPRSQYTSTVDGLWTFTWEDSPPAAVPTVPSVDTVAS